jgi:peroxiredoxin family protein
MTAPTALAAMQKCPAIARRAVNLAARMIKNALPENKIMVEETKAAEKEKMTIVVFSGELDKAIAAFILATTGASMGMEVSMFFTFWGLNILKKNEGVAGGKGLMGKLMNIMNRGGSKRLKLSKFHVFGIGTGMMKQFMKNNRLPSIDEFIVMAKEMGVAMIPCSTSCGIMGLDKDSFREGVDMLAGAAYFLNEARQSKISLFI